jgi:hypothetical protein
MLTPEEQAIRLRVREYMEKEVAPVIVPYWEKAEFPFALVPSFGKLRLAGGTIQGYGCSVRERKGLLPALACSFSLSLFLAAANNCHVWLSTLFPSLSLFPRVTR